MANKKAKLRKTADFIWYQVCLQPECEVCGKGGVLQVHHFYYKSSYGHLRYCIENGISLCRGCHFVLHHQDPKKIEEQIIKKRGRYWYNRLKKKSQKRPEPSYLTQQYYENAIKVLSLLRDAV